MEFPQGGGRHPLASMLDERVAAGGEIARLTINTPRFWLALVAMAVLAALLIWTAFNASALLAILLGVLGILIAYVAIRTVLAGQHSLILTTEGLEDTRGRIVAPIELIEKVDRGTFSIRPSNGFSMRLKEPGPRAWHPGLWWRIGTHVGIGGLTPGGQGRAMADLIAAMIQDRDMGSQSS